MAEAELHARKAMRIAPLEPQAHNLMGMIMTEAQRPQVGEYHYRRARERLPEPSPILLPNIAWNLKNQGRMTESRALYAASVTLDPNVFQTLYGWSKMEETDCNFVRAGELLDAAERPAPGATEVRIQRAVLLGRAKRYEEVIAENSTATLAQINTDNLRSKDALPQKSNKARHLRNAAWKVAGRKNDPGR